MTTDATRPGDPPVEYQATNVLAAVLRELPADDGAGTFPYGLAYVDHVANTVVFTVHGLWFHAAVVVASPGGP